MKESYSVYITEDITYKTLPEVVAEVKKNSKKIIYILHCLNDEVIGRIDVNMILELLEKV